MKKLTSLFLAALMVFSMTSLCLVSASAATLKELTIPSSAKEWNGHCYYVYSGRYTWTKAKALCEKKGGHLVVIKSEKENNVVKNLVEKKQTGYCWLGATDSAKEGTWKWVDGTAMKYTNWYSGQPDNYNGNEDCLSTYYYNEWNDFDNASDEVNGYVCEWDMTKAQSKQIRLNKSSANIYYGSNVTLFLYNTSKTVTWTTSNKNVATVNSKGVVTGKGLGSAYIYAKVGSKKYKCKVTVKDRNQTASKSFKVSDGGYFVKGESTAKVAFKLTKYKAAKAYVSIVNSSGTTVYKKTYSNVAKNKLYSFNWNGKNTGGNYVSAGSYRVIVKVGTKKAYTPYLKFITKNEFADGSGSKTNPFVIATTAQLKKIVKYPIASFKQTANLDFGYEAVGGFFSEDQPFNGTYDGNGKTISNISGTEALFKSIGEKGIVKNVTMKGCSIVGNEQAVLAKFNYGKIIECDINGVVSITISYPSVGLAVWDNFGTISNCVTSGSASTSCDYDSSFSGGVVAINERSGKIISCVSHTNVKAKGNNGIDDIVLAGGIAASNHGMINGCEADGTVEAIQGDHQGGGIAGYNYSQIIDSHYTGSSPINLTGGNSGTIV